MLLRQKKNFITKKDWEEILELYTEEHNEFSDSEQTNQKDNKLSLLNILTETVRDFNEGKPLKKYDEIHKRFFNF